MNCAKIKTANAQSGLEMIMGHSTLPVASAYGTSFIFAIYIGVAGL